MMRKIIIDDSKIKELLTRSVEKIFPSKEFLEEKLRSGEQLSVYLGIDPTGPDLHLGHSVQLFALKRFQDLGHKIIIVIGDFTAQIGDPTGKDMTRRPLSESEVKENAKSYKDQISKILDVKKVDFRRNNDWLGKMTFKEVIKLASLKTVQQLLDRDMFQKRIEKGESIGVHEFFYPLMQGYDSVALKVDGEIGGSDQTFNMLVGRELEKNYLGKDKFVFTTRLLVDPVTQKKMMSKSEGGYVSLKDDPQTMYGKILSLPDGAIYDLFELCTGVPVNEIENLKSSDVLASKHKLAREITKIYHSEKGADLAEKEFKTIFKEKGIPEDIKEVKFGKDEAEIINLLIVSGFISSASEAKRLISQGAVEIDGRVISDWNERVAIKNGTVVRIGPRRFFKAVK